MAAKSQPEKQALNFQQVLELHSMLRSRLDSVQQQWNALNSFVQDLVNALASLDHLNSVQEKEAVRFSLGAGVFVSAFLDKKTKYLISIGDDIYHEASLDEVKQKLERRKEDVLRAIGTAQSERDNLVKQLQEIETILAKAKRKSNNHSETTPAVS